MQYLKIIKNNYLIKAIKIIKITKLIIRHRLTDSMNQK